MKVPPGLLGVPCEKALGELKNALNPFGAGQKRARNRGREWAAALAVRFEPTALVHTARKKAATAELEAYINDEERNPYQ